jgi:hypothetical protein
MGLALGAGSGCIEPGLPLPGRAPGDDSGSLGEVTLGDNCGTGKGQHTHTTAQVSSLNDQGNVLQVLFCGRLLRTAIALSTCPACNQFECFETEALPGSGRLRTCRSSLGYNGQAVFLVRPCVKRSEGRQGGLYKRVAMRFAKAEICMLKT